MATISRNFEAEQTDANLNGASVTTGTDGASISMAAHEGVHGAIEADFPVSPTDDLVVEFYGSTDGGTNFDDTPFHSFTISNTDDPNQLSYILTNAPHTYRVRVKRDGSTDTITVTHKYRRWDYTSA